MSYAAAYVYYATAICNGAGWLGRGRAQLVEQRGAAAGRQARWRVLRPHAASTTPAGAHS